MTSLTTESAQLAANKVTVFDHKPVREIPDDYLTRRFGRAPRGSSNVVYEFTTDAGYLHQYFMMREEMFIRAWGLKQFSGKHDAFDDSGMIMVARQGLQCVGGGRLNISSPENRTILPMEKDDLCLKELFPELDLQDTTYGEFSRLAILPEFQASNVFPEIARRFIQKAVANGVEYAFNIAPEKLARHYQRVVQSFGMKWEVCHHVAVPQRDEYEGIRMAISVMDLSLHLRNRTGATLTQENKLADTLAD